MSKKLLLREALMKYRVTNAGLEPRSATPRLCDFEQVVSL